MFGRRTFSVEKKFRVRKLYYEKRLDVQSIASISHLLLVYVIKDLLVVCKNGEQDSFH